jgi:hypothetical protein
MPLSGEAIRLMNYIDDVAVTLRRVLATMPTLTAEERARVASTCCRPSPMQTTWPGAGYQVAPFALPETVAIIGAGPLGRWLALPQPARLPRAAGRRDAEQPASCAGVSAPGNSGLSSGQ